MAVAIGKPSIVYYKILQLKFQQQYMCLRDRYLYFLTIISEIKTIIAEKTPAIENIIMFGLE
jgi:hypothetical protein